MGSTASISFSSSFSAKDKVQSIPNISKLLSASTADEHSGRQGLEIESNGSKKSFHAVIEKHPIGRHERTKITAIRLILEKERFMVAFLDIIQENGTREFYDFYEALESLKKITPSSKNPSMNYNFKALICSNRILQDFYFNPQCVYNPYTSNETIHKKVINACDPLLQYQEQMINIFTLHQLITNCQNALLAELIPEFDTYVETKYFKQVRILRTLSTKQFTEDFERYLLVGNTGDKGIMHPQLSHSQSASFSVSDREEEEQNATEREKACTTTISATTSAAAVWRNQSTDKPGILTRIHSM